MSFLSVKDVDASYGPVQVLFGLNVDIEEGEIVALLGTNGAGKSTLFKCITGLLPPIAGTIEFMGTSVVGVPTNEIAERGIVMMPGGRSVFPTLTVRERSTCSGSSRMLQAASWRCSSTVSVGKTLRPPGIWTTPSLNVPSGSTWVMSTLSK